MGRIPFLLLQPGSYLHHVKFFGQCALLMCIYMHTSILLFEKNIVNIVKKSGKIYKYILLFEKFLCLKISDVKEKT